MIHTGDKPHCCDVCDRAFKQAAHLQSHQLIHTGYTGDISYNCTVCNESF